MFSETAIMQKQLRNHPKLQGISNTLGAFANMLDSDTCLSEKRACDLCGVLQDYA